MDNLERLLETIDACADRLDQLNAKFPNLTRDDLRESVEYWRKNRPVGSIEIIAPQPRARSEVELVARVPESEAEDNRDRICRIAIELLQSNGLEDTLDILDSEYKVELTIKNLIVLVGKQVYVKALRRDALLLKENAISFDQIADLWNDLDRPAFGGASWTSRSVSTLLQ
ncbi:MAG: hypothetical protein C0631_07710 [Sedimenticola sp.]|nr:MAG: hypothetical protein C0631_07710 [Sedimenticola sp.]